MNDPVQSKEESSSQPEKSSRTPTWVITEWEEPWAKPPPAPPKFSWGLTLWVLVKFGLAGSLMVCAFVFFGDAFELLGRGQRLNMWGFVLLFCLALAILRY